MVSGLPKLTKKSINIFSRMQEVLEPVLHRVMIDHLSYTFICFGFFQFDPGFFLLFFGNAGSPGTWKIWMNEEDGEKKDLKQKANLWQPKFFSFNNIAA